VGEHPPPKSSSAPDAGQVADRQIIEAVERWLQHVVIGLNLCPFARAPSTHGRVRVRVSRAQDTDALLIDLAEELVALQAADPVVVETTLLVHPDVLGDFFEYNDFLDVADECLRQLDLDGELQIASFHPDYQFADATAHAIENCTNRSPYPILHLLRESSVERAAASMPDTGDIYRRNIETLRKLGIDGWRALMAKEDP
jgi:uncharacterized protein